MDSASIRSPRQTLFEPASFAWAWLLGFALVVYLGLDGGGFDPLVGGQVGIVVWWVLLLGLAIGALPRRRPGTFALCVLGILVALVAWTALSLRWTESTEKTATDVARMAALLGVFALALFSRGRQSAEQTVAALASGIAVVAVVAMLSRLHPEWFPDAGQTGRFLATGKERLSYPLDYWNGLAALIGIGIPLMLQIASTARATAARFAAGAALPAMGLALLFTLSRGGIAAALLALAVFLAFTHDRIPQFLTLVVVGLGTAILAVLALHRDELMHGLTDATAKSQGDQMLVATIVVCALVGLAVAGLGLAGSRYQRPAWSKVSREQSLVAVLVAAAVVVVALIAIGAPGRLHNAWDEFREPSGQSVKGTSRLTSVGGENRYQLWSSALREFDQDPFEGTGSGTFQLWWTRDGDVGEPIVDTHSLYMQTLGELGIVGLALLLAFIVTYFVGAAGRVLAAGPERRRWLAAALAASTVLWTTSIFDWIWKIPIIPIATLLLVAVLVTAGDPESERSAALRPRRRIAAAVFALLAIVAIAVPLAGTSLLRQSQSDARDGDAAAALSAARSAQNVQPGAAGPRLQEALLLEAAGNYGPAAAAAAAATEHEPTNWRTWLLLSRIEIERGNAEAGLSAYRKARSLNPLSPVFSES